MMKRVCQRACESEHLSALMYAGRVLERAKNVWRMIRKESMEWKDNKCRDVRAGVCINKNMENARGKM